MDWQQFAVRLEKLKMIKAAELIEQSEQRNSVFPPEDEIALRYMALNPTKMAMMRTGNFNNEDEQAVRAADNFKSWLEGIKKSYSLLDNKNLQALINEIDQDIDGLHHRSTSRKGWLLDNLLNPKKSFNLFGDRAAKKSLWPGSKGGQQQ